MPHYRIIASKSTKKDHKRKVFYEILRAEATALPANKRKMDVENATEEVYALHKWNATVGV